MPGCQPSYRYACIPLPPPFLLSLPFPSTLLQGSWRGRTFNHRQAAAGSNSGGQWLLTCVVGCTGELAFHGNAVNTDLSLVRCWPGGCLLYVRAQVFIRKAVMMDRES